MNGQDNGYPTIKIVIVGDGAVGKTSLLMSYTTNEFPQWVPTVMDLHNSTISVDEKSYNLSLWDVTNSEDFMGLRQLSYPQTDVFMVCYSIASPTSFDNVASQWIPEIQHKCGKDIPFILVGTKIDLRNDSAIIAKLAAKGQTTLEKERGVALAMELGTEYLECSALTQEGLKEVFARAIHLAINKPVKENKKQCCLQ
jgi:small GTP-binding protein